MEWIRIVSDEKEVGVGCGLKTFYYLESFVNDLEQLTDEEKKTLLGYVFDLIIETGKVAKARVKEAIRIFLRTGTD